ncbi:autotransporter-associated beta strand protein [Plasticicumulans lactativorans]|uniref:Autotransporter-associated beta strand protein n=1 Tax=Plasticicumulans lactativorans TaxID=1133106 RepID=A0A4R2L4Y9_9GAMM|nr:autotransporter-associated beta strand repeat-containing protein [Plasticicumulans lactativorans]TCO81543.1 autotransporter-associated beta strand protein [Plasticicumulans lactativorans]
MADFLVAPGRGLGLLGVFAAAPALAANVIVNSTIDAADQTDVAAEPTDIVFFEGGRINALSPGFTTYSRITIVNPAGGTFAVPDAGHSVAFSGPVGGAGTLTLAGPGVFDISAGAMAAFAGTLDLVPEVPDVAPVVTMHELSGAFTIETGNGLVLDNLSGSTFDGNIVIAPDAVLTKIGSGTLTLNGSLSGSGATPPAIATGLLNVTLGSVVLGAGASLPSFAAPLVASGATLDLGSGNHTLAGILGTGTVNVDGTLTLTADAAALPAFAATMTGSGDFTVQRDLSLGTPLAITGGLLVQSSTLTLTVADAIAAASRVTLDGGALDVAGGDQTFHNFGGSGVVFAFGTPTLTFVNDTDTSFSGDHFGSGEAALVKEGSGSLTLNGILYSAGSLAVNAGTLVLGSNDALPGAASFQAPEFDVVVTVASGATLDLGATQQTFGSLSGSGSVNVGAGGLIVFDANAGPIAVGTALSGGGGMLTRNGDVDLTAASYGLSGPVTVESGTLTQGGNQLDTAASITIDVGAELASSGDTATLNNLSGGGSASFDVIDVTLANTTDTVFDGTLSGSIDNLTKTGTGALTLNQTAPLPVLATLTVDQGTLRLSGSDVLAAHLAPFVEVGATLDLAGAQQTLAGLQGGGSVLVNGTLTLDASPSGAGIDPVIGGSGTLVFSNAFYDLNTVATFTGAVQLVNATVSLNPTDAIASAGSVTLDAASVLEIHSGSLPSIAQTLHNLSGSGAIDLFNAALTLDNSVDTVFSGDLNDTALSITKTGAAMLTLSGTLPLSLGSLSVAAGTLQLTHDEVFASLGSGFTPQVDAGATLDFAASTQTLGSVAGSGRVSSAGQLTFVGDGNGNAALAVELAGPGQFVFAAPNASLLTPATLSGSVAVASGTLTLVADNALASAGGLDIASGATLAADGTVQTLPNVTGSGTITVDGANLYFENTVDTVFAGAISGGAGTLGKLGPAQLTLAGSLPGFNTLAVEAGTLQLTASANGVLDGNQAVSVAAGALLDLTTTTQTLADVSGTGTVHTDGVLILQGQTEGERTFGLTINGSGSLVTEIGALRLDSPLTLTGPLQVASGQLTLGADDALATLASVTIAADALIVAGGTQQTLHELSGAGSLDYSAALTLDQAGTTTFSGALTGLGGAALTKTGAGALTLAGSLSGSGPLTVAGGTLTLAGSGSGYTGAVGVSSGSLVLTGNDVLANSSALAIASGASVLAGGTRQTLHDLSGAGSLDYSAALTLGQAGTTTFSGALTGLGGAALTKTGAGALTLAGSFSGSGPLTVAGGTLTLAGSGSGYTGTVVVSAGSLVLAADDVLASSGTLAIASGASVLAGGTRQTLHDLIGAGSLDYSAALTLDPGESAVFSGALNGLDGAPLTKAGSGALTLAGSFSGSGPLTVAGGILALSGNGSGYSGAVAVDAGTLVLTGDDVLANSAGVTVASGAGVEIGGNQQTLRGLAGAGGVLIGGESRFVLDVAGGGSFAGTLAGGGVFEKRGNGAFSLSGDSGAFTGLTEVTAGRLAVNGTLGGQVSVGSGGVFGGVGTVPGAIAVAGMLDPGNSIGTLTVGSVSFASGSVFHVEVDSAGNADLVHATGTVQINGGTVQISSVDGGFKAGTSYTVLTADQGITGEFSNVVSSLPLFAASASYSANAVQLGIPTPNQNAELSPVDLIGGNPTSLIARMVSSDEAAGFLLDPTEIGFAQGVAGIDYIHGQFSSNGFNQHYEQFPLQYSWKLSNGWTALLDMPITTISTEGHGVDRRDYSVSVGGGVRIPMNEDWQLKPIVRWGTVVDDDYNHIGSLASASLTSHYRTKFGAGGRYEFGMDNQLGYYTSVGGDVVDLDARYNLHETALRNALRVGGPLEGTPLGGGARWSAWVADTRYYGSDLAVDNFQKLGFAVTTRVGVGKAVGENVSMGVTFTRADGDNGFELNFGYRF